MSGLNTNANFKNKFKYFELKILILSYLNNFSGNTGTCLLSNVRLTSTRGVYTKIDYDYTQTYTEDFYEDTQTEAIVKRMVK